jgi:hypothetical protein
MATSALSHHFVIASNARNGAIPEFQSILIVVSLPHFGDCHGTPCLAMTDVGDIKSPTDWEGGGP